MSCVNIILVAGELPLASQRGHRGSIAQLGEHLPYKQRVTGSSPVVPTTSGPVAQLVRAPACHAGGRRFETVLGRQICFCSSVGRAGD